jgi:hypothetical protein
MVVTVLWEDQYGRDVRAFGPHELLVACLSDELSSELPDVTRHQVQKIVQSHPKKGNAGIRKALQRDLPRLKKSGPVFAVVDSDRVRDLWKHSGISAPNCRAAWQVSADERRAIRAECPCFDRIVERVSVAVAAAMLCS